MFRSKHFGLILPVMMVVTVLSSTSFAQKSRYLRWAGYGISDGYHVANPGPNSDYYDPYTKHNSGLWIKTAEHPPLQSNTQRASVSSFSKYPRFSSPTRRTFNRNSAIGTPSTRATDNSFQPTLKENKSPARFKPSSTSDQPKPINNEFSIQKPQRSPQLARPISIARSLPAPKSNHSHLESVVIPGGIK
ncbi:hypothetical protein N9B22_01440 [bacterium]|nr:hypothetical protein [Mariniblastus sp.]MDA7861710.1 hypothetical protein [bacterium]MDA7880248.1 hypothetical protein [Mariniblastus sp.]